MLLLSFSSLFSKLFRIVLPNEYRNSLYDRKYPMFKQDKLNLIYFFRNESQPVTCISLGYGGAKLINCLVETLSIQLIFRNDSSEKL